MTDGVNTQLNLPKGWIWTYFEDVTLPPQYGWTTKGVEMGKLHLLRTTDIAGRDINWDSVPFCKEEPPDIQKYLLKAGDIVISRAGSVGYSKLIRNPKTAVFASYLIRFKPLIDEQFFAYFLRSPSYWKSISQKSIGIAIPNVNASKLKKIRIPLPPLREQYRIVVKLEELFAKLEAGINSLQNVKAQLQLYRQAVLKQAFNGKLTEEWRKTYKDTIESASTLLEQIRQEQKKKEKSKYREPSEIDTNGLLELPETWTWTSLSDISRIKMGQSPSGSSYNNQCQGIPLLNGPTEFGKDHPTPVQWTTAPTKMCKKEDLLICVRGNTTGRMNWADQQYCIGRGLAAITPIKGIVRRELLFYFLLMKTNEIMHITSGSTFPNLKSSELRSFPFPLAPFSEQKELSNRLDRIFISVERLAGDAKINSDKSKILRMSILKKTFEGKLESQDTADEPAERLLERIKQEKERRSNQKKGSSRIITRKKNQRRLNGYVE